MEALQTLPRIPKRGVDFRAEAQQLLNNDPVLFRSQIHDTAALTADDHMVSVKPAECLEAVVAAMIARHGEFDAVGSR